MEIPALDLASLRTAYAAGTQTPASIIKAVHAEAALEDLHIFTHVQLLQTLLDRCAALEKQPASQRGQLWGVPFAVKDNVDVAGMPTTAGCKSFAYTPEETAPAIASLIQAGERAEASCTMRVSRRP
jgi:allophanate hydrolase